MSNTRRITLDAVLVMHMSDERLAKLMSKLLYSRDHDGVLVAAGTGCQEASVTRNGNGDGGADGASGINQQPNLFDMGEWVWVCG